VKVRLTFLKKSRNGPASAVGASPMTSANKGTARRRLGFKVFRYGKVTLKIEDLTLTEIEIAH
jgi:hypothetical protein